MSEENPRGFESVRERKVWLVIYVVIIIALAAGAARRIYGMF